MIWVSFLGTCSEDTAVPMQSENDKHRALGSDVKVDGKEALPACLGGFTLTHCDDGLEEVLQIDSKAKKRTKWFNFVSCVYGRQSGRKKKT